jgi:hypothetical protein
MTTTTTPSLAPTGSMGRSARIGTIGGALWALLPVASGLVSVDDVEFGTLAFVAVAASYWIFAVLAPALLLAGVTALRRALGDSAGRVGTSGMLLAAVGYVGMSLGTGIEVASISFGGGEVAVGHALLLIGFLVSILGGILLGITVVRRRRGGLARAGGLLLTLALPVGIGIGLFGSTIDPNNDAWFWAAIAVPTGIAWVVLGSSLAAAGRSPAR